VTEAATWPRINDVAEQLPRSGIREVMDAAWGRPDVIHLEVGEPDFATPAHIVEAAHRAVAAGATHYTPTAGVPELRERLADKVSRRDARPVSAEQVIATHGGVAGIYLTLQALCGPGDEVLLPDPAWPNFLMMAKLLRLEPRLYPLRPETGFVPLVEDVEALVTPRTRLLLLNSPSNPLGAVLSRDRTRELTELAARHELWVLSDECYDELLFADGGFTSPAPFAHDRVVTVGSFSKTYAMTGWRIGYVTAPAEVVPTIVKCMEPLLSCANTPAQMAAIAALDGPQTVVTQMRNSYLARRDAAVELLQKREQPLLVPDGAFYLWVDISESGLLSREFALRLLAEQSVAVAPGTAFGGGEGYVRVSLATAQPDLLEGLQRLATFAAEVRRP
jgi:aspartate/methionine/tyrosine aminotransferase